MLIEARLNGAVQVHIHRTDKMLIAKTAYIANFCRRETHPFGNVRTLWRARHQCSCGRVISDKQFGMSVEAFRVCDQMLITILGLTPFD